MTTKTLLRYLLLLVFLSVAYTLSGQYKYEREYGIRKENVPEKALDFIDACRFRSNVDWYREESQDGISIEAKIDFAGHRYSIEFDTTGYLQDMEKKVKMDDLEKNQQEVIRHTLRKKYGSYKIKKIQLQWTGTSDQLLKVIRAEGNPSVYPARHEIVLYTDTDEGWKSYEVLLHADGEVIQTLELKQRATDNLDF